MEVEQLQENIVAESSASNVPSQPRQEATIQCHICGEDIEAGTEICPYCNEQIL